MTVQFIDVIDQVLVKEHGIRVIMTTHSPSTVALAPSGAVFELERGAESIRPVRSAADAVAMLTSGIVTVSKSSKFCFVEDEDDVSFYEAIRDILTDFGPSQDPMALKPAPTIAFLAASIGARAAKIAGGCTVVRQWVEKLDAEPLESSFCGIIDRDTGNGDSPRVKVIGRYSIENYLLDPLNIYSLLLGLGRHPPIPGVEISQGNEHQLRTLDDQVLQAITDKITATIEAMNGTIRTGTVRSVSYQREEDARPVLGRRLSRPRLAAIGASGVWRGPHCDSACTDSRAATWPACSGGAGVLVVGDSIGVILLLGAVERDARVRSRMALTRHCL